MRKAYDAVAEWLEGNFEGYMADRFPHVLRAIFSCETSVRISDVVSKIGDLANLTEERIRMPLVDWPWLDGLTDLRDNNYVYTYMADILHRTRGGHLYVLGNDCKLHAGPEGVRYFLAKNEDWETVNPPGKFEKWYYGGTGKGLTLTRLKQEGDPGYNKEYEDELKRKDIRVSGTSARAKSYWNVRPEIAIVCAFAVGHSEMCRFAVSSIISMAFVQAVSVSRGASDTKCDAEVLRMCNKLPTNTVGGQIAILAAIYSRLMLPRGDEELLRGKLGVSSGLLNIDHMKLSNNLYWLRNLTDFKARTSVKPQSNDAIVELGTPCFKHRCRGYRLSAVENALVFRDVSRTLLWFSVSFFVIVTIAVSVAFQQVKWAEKLEKFLNLMFTVLIATVIGLASIHTEENMLGNVIRFRRRISDVSDFPEQLFTDVVEYIEGEQRKNGKRKGKYDDAQSKSIDLGRFISPENSSWVSEYNRGETKLGRPVLLSELSNSKISISSRFEFSLCTNDERRNLHINASGTCNVSGPAAATSESYIFLDAPVRLG